MRGRGWTLGAALAQVSSAAVAALDERAARQRFVGADHRRAADAERARKHPIGRQGMAQVPGFAFDDRLDRALEPLLERAVAGGPGAKSAGKRGELCKSSHG